MGWIERTTERLENFSDRMEKKIEENQRGDAPAPSMKGPPSPLDVSTVDEFLEAGQEGQKPNTQKPPPSFEEHLQMKDPVRLFALRRHIKWVKREARKYGIDEERIGWWLL